MTDIAPDFNKLTVAELKKNLASRGLSQDGKKQDLISRLTENEKEKEGEMKTEQCEEEKEEEEKEEEEKEEEEKEEEKKEEETMEVDKPDKKEEKEYEKEAKEYLTKWRYKSVYDALRGLKTVMIRPFLPETHMCPTLSKWMSEATEFIIKKQKDGSSAAMLAFKNVDEGDSCFAELRGLISDDITSVYHYTFNTSYVNGKCMTLEKIFTPVDEADEMHRSVLFEDCPDDLTEESVLEVFPEGFNFIHFGKDLWKIKGIATLELPSLAKVEEVASKPEVEIDGHKITVTKLNTKLNKWFKFGNVIRALSEKECGQKELTDEERVAKCERMQELSLERETIQDREDLFGFEKIKQYFDSLEEFRLLENQIKFDTDRRVAAKSLIMPESKDLYTSYTRRKLVKVENGTDGQKASPHAQKRASSTPQTGSASAKKPYMGGSRGGARGGFSPRGRGSPRGYPRGGGGGGGGRFSGGGGDFSMRGYDRGMGGGGFDRMYGGHQSAGLEDMVENLSAAVSELKQERMMSERVNLLAEQKAKQFLSTGYGGRGGGARGRGAARGSMNKADAFRAGYD